MELSKIIFFFMSICSSVNSKEQSLAHDEFKEMQSLLEKTIFELVELKSDLDETKAEVQQLKSANKALEKEHDSLKVLIGQEGLVVIFSVVHETSSSEWLDGLITFNKEVSNIGNHFNIESGTFKAPVDGFYNFWLSATTGNNGATQVAVMKNGQIWLRVFDSDSNGYYKNFNHSFQIYLKENDEVQLKIIDGLLYVSSEVAVTFTGELVYSEL